MTKRKKAVAGNVAATGGVTGKGFMPGKSGNPLGRAAIGAEMRATLQADTPARYERLKKLSAALEEQGDLKGASTIELALFKKQVPDLSAIEITGEDGGPIKTESIDVRKLSPADLLALKALRDKSRTP